MTDACKDRFTTWIDQGCGGTILGEVVVVEVHDAALAREAALREELGKADPPGSFDKHMQYMRENIDLQKRLTAAEQRNADIKQFLAELIVEAGYDWLSSEAVAKMKEFLKPTESGASE